MILLVPVIVAGVVVAYVYRSRTSPHGKIMSVLDAHMPAALRSAVANVVTKGNDPAAAAQLAKKLQTASYPVAAAVVATRVKQQVVPAPSPKLVYSSGPAQSRSSTSSEVSDPHSS